MPSFDEAPARSKKPEKKQINHQLEDDDDIFFDIAVDIVEKGEKQPEETIVEFCDDNDWDDNSTKSFNLSKLIKSCEPKVASELALSKQKQNEMANWLTSCRRSKTPSVLLISGPAGCGKTVAFKVLAEERGFGICEWLTPIDQAVDENGKFKKCVKIFFDSY